MTTTVHIVSSTAIAGLVLSTYNINLFGDELLLGLVVVFSVLPDVDIRQSIIGRLLYPISWLISSRFPHRTITHSASAIALIYAILLLFPQAYRIALVTSYSVHIFGDMMTYAGVQFFYPFVKNRCVLIGNDKYRFRNENNKHNAILLCCFGFVLFSFQDLYKKGFWTYYRTEIFANTTNLKALIKENPNRIINTNLGEVIAIYKDSVQLSNGGRIANNEVTEYSLSKYKYNWKDTTVNIDIRERNNYKYVGLAKYENEIKSVLFFDFREQEKQYNESKEKHAEQQQAEQHYNRLIELRKKRLNQIPKTIKQVKLKREELQALEEQIKEVKSNDYTRKILLSDSVFSVSFAQFKRSKMRVSTER